MKTYKQIANQIRKQLDAERNVYVLPFDPPFIPWKRVYNVRVRNGELEGKVLADGKWIRFGSWEVRP